MSLSIPGKPDDDTAAYLATMAGPSPAFEAGRLRGLEEAREIAQKIAQSVRGMARADVPGCYARGWRAAVDAVAGALYVARNPKR